MYPYADQTTSKRTASQPASTSKDKGSCKITGIPDILGTLFPSARGKTIEFNKINDAMQARVTQKDFYELLNLADKKVLAEMHPGLGGFIFLKRDVYTKV